MTAKPLTREQWDRVRRDARLRVGEFFKDDRSYKLSEGDDDIVDRIEATIENGGFAPEEPTPYELDKWAARKIMGWIQTGATWAKPADTIAGFRNIIDTRDWKPSVDLGQALECVKQARHSCQGVFGVNGHTMAWLGGAVVYDDDYDSSSLAEAIVRKLHAELTP